MIKYFHSLHKQLTVEKHKDLSLLVYDNKCDHEVYDICILEAPRINTVDNATKGSHLVTGMCCLSVCPFEQSNGLSFLGKGGGGHVSLMVAAIIHEHFGM